MKTIMISKFDTYSEIMAGYYMDPAWCSKYQQFQDVGMGFLAWIFKKISKKVPWFLHML